MPLEEVRRLGRASERWRFQREDAISARRRSLAAPAAEKPEPGPELTEPDALFEEVGRDTIGDFGDWALLVRG
eukprot:5504915-Lingulodinium_polyedra.AAC.1